MSTWDKFFEYEAAKTKEDEGKKKEADHRPVDVSLLPKTVAEFKELDTRMRNLMASSERINRAFRDGTGANRDTPSREEIALLNLLYLDGNAVEEAYAYADFWGKFSLVEREYPYLSDAAKVIYDTPLYSCLLEKSDGGDREWDPARSHPHVPYNYQKLGKFSRKRTLRYVRFFQKPFQISHKEMCAKNLDKATSVNKLIPESHVKSFAVMLSHLVDRKMVVDGVLMQLSVLPLVTTGAYLSFVLCCYVGTAEGVTDDMLNNEIGSLGFTNEGKRFLELENANTFMAEGEGPTPAFPDSKWWDWSTMPGFVEEK